MKAKIKINRYKKAVSSICSAVNEQTSNQNEKTVRIEAKDQSLLLTAVCNGSHRLTQEVPAEVITPGFLYIQSGMLKDMSRHLPSGIEDLTLLLNEKLQFTYNLNGLGSIKEPIFNNQEAHRGIVFKEETFKALTSECKLLNKAISLSATGGDTYPEVWIKAEAVEAAEGEVSVYKQIYKSAYVKYSFKQVIERSFSGSFKHQFLKLDDLGANLDIAYGISPTALRFSSDQNELVLIGSLSKADDLDIADFIVSQECIGRVTLNRAELERAIAWQSYQPKADSAINLRLEKDTLKVQLSQGEEPAEITVCEYDQFKSIDLPLIGIQNALKAVNVGAGSDLIALKQYELSISPYVIKVLCLEPWDETELSALAVLYEQVKLNR